MKLVAVGDAYITSEMMLKNVDEFEFITDAKVFYFGEKDRGQMRNTVKLIESGKRDLLQLPEGLLENLREAEILMVHLCPVTQKVLDAAPNLKYVLCNRGGVENIDVEALNKRNITLVHNPAHNANAVAELTVGLMIAETRNIARANYALKNNIWREKFPNSKYFVRELKHLTVGIIGFGSVGRLVAEKLKSFGCDILICDPYLELAAHDVITGKFVNLDELLKKSDVITLHARGNSYILDEKEFEKMKSTAYVINTARPHLINTKVLLEYLKNNKILGAAVDVFESEPNIPKEYCELDNITLTNHRGSDTLESYSDSPKMMLDNLMEFLNGGKLKFWYNKKILVK